MPCLLNVESSRELREGDEVRAGVGLRKGTLGKVVGFDVLSEDPVVVQYPALRKGVIREQFGANDVDLVQAAASLEPLPEVPGILQESGSYHTCGAMICLKLHEHQDLLTLVPKGPGKPLREILVSSVEEKGSFREAIQAALREAFVTRLPHLVDFGLSREIDAVLEREIETDVALDWLLQNQGSEN